MTIVARSLKRVCIVLAFIVTTPLLASGDLTIVQCDGKGCPELRNTRIGDSSEENFWCMYIDGRPIDRSVLSRLPIDDRLHIIAQLLAMEGDERISGDCETNIHELSSRTTFGKLHSVQLEALYLIHFVACTDSMSWYYAPVQELRDLVTGEVESESGKIVRKAFVIYQAWFESMRRSVAKHGVIDPRDCRPLMKSDEVDWVSP